ncbi:hypothetical protein IPM19_04395 [bacterium]|nr:MAG: hypothetical protein IPM19_04395 [bacterium]
MIKSLKKSMKYKVALFVFAVVAAGFAVALPAAEGKNVGSVIKNAIAETSCPAPIPSSYATLRSGSANGPIIGTYENQGWNSFDAPQPTFAEVTIPSGTVIYYSNHTEGVELTNRSQGSTHGYSSGATVTSPSNKAGFYATGYYFTKQQQVAGFTSPITADTFMSVGGHNSCWGGFNDGESLLSIQIRVQNAPPTPTIKTGTTNLAVVKDPTVSLLVNGQQSVTVSNGATPTLTWSTSSVNIGDSCSATNNYPSSSNPAPNWNGAKLGQAAYTPPNPPPPGGGSQQVGPFTSAGTFTYSILCYGLNNVASQVSSVQITVGDAPSYSCTVSPPGVQGVPRGSNRSATMRVVPQNGYNSPVDFTVTSITPSVPVPPVVTISGNPQTAPYSGAAIATIATSVNPATTTGEYTIQVTGTGGVNCPPIRINVTSDPGSINIKFNGSDGPVTLNPPINSGTLSWAPVGDVEECTASMTEGDYPAWSGSRPPTGTQGVTNLQSNTRYTFKIDCITSFGEQVQPDSVTVIVGSPPAVDPFVDLKCKGTNPVNPTFVDGVCTVFSGDRAQLQARSGDATSCVLTPGIPGYTPTPNETTTVSTPPILSNTVYNLRCQGADGTNSQEDEVEIRVANAVDAFVDLKCKGTNPVNPTFVDGVCTVNSGDRAQLQASSADATSCTLTPAISGYTPTPNVTTTTNTPNITSNTRYTLRCNGGPGSQPQEDEVEIRIATVADARTELKCKGTNPVNPEFVTGSCTINSGDQAQLQASSSNAGSCTLTPAISGYAPTPNATTQTYTPNLTSSQLYTLRCTSVDGSSSSESQVDIIVAAGPPAEAVLKCKGTNPVNPTFVDGSCTVNSGDRAQLQASSLNVNSCTLTPAISGYTPTPNTTTTTLTSPITSTTTFTLRCINEVTRARPTSTVTINVANTPDPEPNFTFECSGSPLPIMAGGSAGVITITTTASDWPAGTAIAITNSSTPLSVSYINNNPNNPPATTVISISAGSMIVPGSYMIVFTGTPSPSILGVNYKDCPVTVIVGAGSVEPPTNVNATTTCGQATVTWGPPMSGPTPDGYQIFRTVTLGSGGVPVFPIGPIATVSGSTFFFRDNSPEINISSYYGIKSTLGGATSTITRSNPVYVEACAPSLDQSDKDVYAIDAVTGSPLQCQDNSPFSLPSDAIIRANSRVYFNINVCNSGNVELTNIRVIETDLHNLTDLRLENQGGCVTGGAGTKSNPFRVSNLPAPAVPGQYTVCTIKISAKATAPSSTPGLLHRFWNIAYIYSNELPAGKKVSTPPYTFSVGGAPTRTETAP